MQLEGASRPGRSQRQSQGRRLSDQLNPQAASSPTHTEPPSHNPITILIGENRQQIIQTSLKPTPTPTPSPTPETIAEEVKVQVAKGWADKLWKLSDKDGIINVHIDKNGSFNKQSRRLSTKHTNFATDFLAEVSEATDLKINCTIAENADILI